MKKLDLKEIFQKLKIGSFKDLISNTSGELGQKKSLKLSQKQKINFFDSLYSLINSGIPITNSLSIMLFQTKDKNVKFLLQTITKEISKGKKLEEILKDFDKIFSNFDIYMIKMGEVTGKLAGSFETIRDREEKMQN